MSNIIKCYVRTLGYLLLFKINYLSFCLPLLVMIIVLNLREMLDTFLFCLNLNLDVGPLATLKVLTCFKHVCFFKFIRAELDFWFSVLDGRIPFLLAFSVPVFIHLCGIVLGGVSLFTVPPCVYHLFSILFSQSSGPL